MSDAASPARKTPANETRRRAMRRQTRLNGIDFVDAGDDRRSLTVTFFHLLPRDLAPEHFTVSGGVRVVAPAVVEVRLRDPGDPGEAPSALLIFAHAGDESVYRLSILGLDGFDPRFDAIDFSFGRAAAVRASPLVARPAPRRRVELDYLAKDAEGFRRVAFERMAQTLPSWTERHAPDIGVTLIEMMAYVGDQLSLYQDAVATEAYLGTARLRQSVRRHARLIDYAMHEGCNARAWVLVSSDVALTVQPGDIAFAVEDSPALEFAPVEARPIRLSPAFAAIAFYDWGEEASRLPAGATRATFVDAWTDPDKRETRRLDDLAAGDVLLFEAEGDEGAQPCHVVRLRAVARGEDPLFDTPVLEVAWSAEDALPPDLADRTLVARGTMVLVDHGRTVADETLAERPDLAGSPRPVLRRPDLTFRAAPEPDAAANPALRQDPRDARPELLALRAPLDPALVQPGRDSIVAWAVRPDLIESAGDDAHVVVEMEDDGMAALRFGDGVCGARRGEGPVTATYRVGNGPVGNVGVGAINIVVARGDVDLAGLAVRNPQMAVGGASPESIADVRRIAPGQFRVRQERAVTADDYGRAAEEVFGVRRAHAELLQIGMARLARVAVLPRGGFEASPALLDRVRALLEDRRLIGHDVEVRPARVVPLEIGLAVGVESDHLRAHVRAPLRAVLGAGLQADGTPGLFHPDLMSFGQPVVGSRIVAAAQAVVGVQWVRLVSLRRIEDAPEAPGETTATLVLGPAEIARMDDDPTHPEHGRLALAMEGGR